MVKIIDPRTHVFHFFINASSFFFFKGAPWSEKPKGP